MASIKSAYTLLASLKECWTIEKISCRPKQYRFLIGPERNPVVTSYNTRLLVCFKDGIFKYKEIKKKEAEDEKEKRGKAYDNIKDIS